MEDYGHKKTPKAYNRKRKTAVYRLGRGSCALRSTSVGINSGKHSGLDIKFASCFILFILFLRKPELGQGSGVE